MAYDPETPSANSGGTILEAVTKDQLNTGLTGQLRYQVAERNLYVLPGTVCGAPGRFRIAFTASREMLERALPIFSEAFAEVRGAAK